MEGKARRGGGLGVAGIAADTDLALRDQGKKLDRCVVAGQVIPLPSVRVKACPGKQIIEGDILGKLVDDLGNRGERDGVPLGEIAVNLAVRVRDGLVNEWCQDGLSLLWVLNPVVVGDDLTHRVEL